MSAVAIVGECVVWTGATMNTGYGHRYYPADGDRPHRWALAHRDAWEKAHGPIPSGMNVHHRCENRLCVNVDHLELLTNADHHGAAGHGKLTKADADVIRLFREAGHRGMDVAAAFDVSQQQVCNIVKGRCWA